MRPNRHWTALAAAASLLALAACGADNKDAKVAAEAPKVAAEAPKVAAEAPKEPAAATVNGTPITQRAVDSIVRQGARSGQPDTPETRKSIIEQLALQMVVAEEAVKKGLDKSPEVAEQLSAIRQSVLANAYVQDFVKNNPVTDEMLKAEYERLKATIGGTEYKARHILVEKEAEAKDIIAKLAQQPGAFAKLAKARSQDPGSKANGGDLGWFAAGSMAPEFGAAVGKLEKGKLTTEPVKTQFGYHVILLEDTRPIEPPSLDEVRRELGQRLQQQNVMQHVDSLKAKAKIEIAAASPGPAPATPSQASPAAPATPSGAASQPGAPATAAQPSAAAPATAAQPSAAAPAAPAAK